MQNVKPHTVNDSLVHCTYTYVYVSLSLRAGEENPASLAESCFRELLGRAAYGNMNNAVHPVLV